MVGRRGDSFPSGAANVALALYAFTPSLIANFSVATTDGIGALFIFVVAYQLIRWRRNPVPIQTVLMGLALGGLLLAKFYAPPLALLALGLMLVLNQKSGLRPPPQWNWKPALLALVIAVLSLWAGYFFHVARLHIADGQVAATIPQSPPEDLGHQVEGRDQKLVVPAGEFFEGLREVALSNRRGRPSWFLGRIYPAGGIKAYYPVAIALKWPGILLLLFLLSLILGVRKTTRAPGDLLVDVPVWPALRDFRGAVEVCHRRTAHPPAVSFRTTDCGRDLGACSPSPCGRRVVGPGAVSERS